VPANCCSFLLRLLLRLVLLLLLLWPCPCGAAEVGTAADSLRKALGRCDDVAEACIR
jgi:hypothetical protein